LPDINDERLNLEHKKYLELYEKNIFLNLGDVYFKNENYLEAEKYYQLAYKRDYNDFTIFKRIADTYYLRGDFSKAREYDLRGAVRSPSDYRWPYMIAFIYRIEGNKEMAHKYFMKALDLAPQEKLLLDLKNEY